MMIGNSQKLLMLFSALALVSCGSKETAPSQDAETEAAAEAESATAATPTTEEVAYAFLNAMFREDAGDAGGDAYEMYATPDFIQHNPNMDNGLKGRKAFFEKLRANMPESQQSSTEWRNVFDMILIDGDLFGVLRHAFTGPDDKGRIFFDIWRVENGKIVEHWDVIQPTPENFVHDNTAWCGVGNSYEEAGELGDTLANPTCGGPDPNANREETLAVIDQYVTAVGQGDVEAAIREWFHPDYKQHSYYIGDGAEGAIEYLNMEWGDKAGEKPHLEHARMLAQGDLVAYHMYVRQPGDPLGNVQVDIFRVTDGKISEHWDFKQPVVKETVSGNKMW